MCIHLVGFGYKTITSMCLCVCGHHYQVIQALEQLERLSLQREQESASLHDLRKTVERLEAEKTERAAERQRFEKVGARRESAAAR